MIDWSYMTIYRNFLIAPFRPFPTPPEGPTAMRVAVISFRGENLTDACRDLHYKNEDYIYQTERVFDIGKAYVDNRYWHMEAERRQVEQEAKGE